MEVGNNRQKYLEMGQVHIRGGVFNMTTAEMLPPEFAELNVEHVARKGKGHYTSSCPECGSAGHYGSDLPDRFCMWDASASKIGKPFGWCRKCGYKWWAGKGGGEIDPLKVEQWRQERIAEEERRKLDAEQALKLLRDERAWKSYYSWLKTDAIAKRHWRAAGFTEPYWWREWGLGYDPAHEFWWSDGARLRKHITPTMTIAMRNLAGEIINVKHRLLTPQPNGVKYRMQYRTYQEPLFMANLELKNTADRVVICEGEKKAGVFFQVYDDPAIQVFGLPLTPSEELLSSIHAKHILYIPDPDATQQQIWRIIKNTKADTKRVLRLFDKVDDLIVEHKLGTDWLRRVSKQAYITTQ